MARNKKEDKSKSCNRSVVFTLEMLEQIEKLAIKNNMSSSEVIRGFVDKGMSVESYSDNVDFISGIVRQEVKVEMEKQANRLAAMLFKIGIISASNYFMAVRLMADVINPSMQEDFKDINSNARQLGIDYMKQSGVNVVEFLEDDEAVSVAVDKLKTDFLSE